jgi:hypothetical protein
VSVHVPAALRRLVALRAEGVCEYCLIHESDTFAGSEVEHIISVKHGGLTEADNLAWACMSCNRHKGTDIASIARSSGRLVPLFNPRVDRWIEHFRLRGATIEPLTEVGEVTVAVLSLNDPDRVMERVLLIAAGRFPPIEAARLLR